MTLRIAHFGPCQLILGDCLDPAVVDAIGDIDGLVTDPPYQFDNSGGGAFRNARKAAREITRKGLDKGFDPAALRLGSPASVVVFCHNDQLVDLLPRLKADFARHVVLTWHKSNPVPLANRHYRPDTEFFVHAWGPGAHPLGDLRDLARYWIGPVGKSEFDHPTVKPLGLMRKVVRNMNARRVLDPFMGTGTTGEACLREGKAFVGVERDPAYFDMACARLDRAVRSPPLFEERGA